MRPMTKVLIAAGVIGVTLVSSWPGSGRSSAQAADEAAGRPADAGAGGPVALVQKAGDDRGGQKRPDVIWVPTPHEVVEEMLKLADIQKGDVLYDLGCGDGRIVVAA